MRKSICVTTRMILPLLTAMSGCGGGEEEAEVAHRPAQVVTAEVVDAAAAAAALEEEGAEEEEAEYSPPFLEKAEIDPFAPPAVLPELEPEPEPEPEPKFQPPPSLPPLKLLGFIKVDDPRAILDIDGDRVIVGVGDKVSNVKILEVESPAITVQFGLDQIAMNLHADGITGAKRTAVPLSNSFRRDRPAGGPTSGSPRIGNPDLPRVTTPSLPPANAASGALPLLPAADASPRPSSR